MKLITALLLFSITAEAKYRNDVFLPDTKDNPRGFYLFPDQDFNVLYNLNPGDTVGFLPGYYGGINLGPGKNVNGITFMVDSNNKDTVFMKWFGLGNFAQDCKLIGQSKYLQYGLVFSDSNHFALSWTATGKLEASWFISRGNRIGVQLMNVDGQVYAKDEQNIYLHDAIIEGALGESVYIGYVNQSKFLTGVKLERVKSLNSGWDAFQFKSCKPITIVDCIADGAGLAKSYGQDHGLIIGHNTNGAIIKNVSVKNVNGAALWIGGYGQFDIDCSVFDGKSFSVLTRNTIPEQDEQNIGYQKISFNNCELISTSPTCIYSLYAGTIPSSIFVANSKTVGRFDIAPGIGFSQFNTGSNVAVSCNTIVLPVTVINFKASGTKPVKLSWSVAQETNVLKYTVERSSNGTAFLEIGNVFAVGAGGYKFLDYSPGQLNYYRLKILNVDGRYSYSKIITVRTGAIPRRYTIVNTLGQTIAERTENTWEELLRTLIPGRHYFVSWHEGNTLQTLKIFVTY